MISFNKIIIEKIHKSHNLSNFKSYEKDLENFLIEDALDNQKQNISITFLFFHNNELVSYISLLTDRINLNKKLQKQFKKKNIHYKTLPALKVGRMCVHNSFRFKGLGQEMILFAIKKIKEINKNKAGCRFLIVDSKENAIKFYKKMNFEKLKEKENILYLDLKA